METQAQHAERGSSPDDGAEPRFARPRGLFAGVLEGPWRRAGLGGLVLLVALLLLSTFVAQPFLIPSGSMEPAMRDGDRVLVNKVAYRFGSEPERGDAVVFDGAGSFVPEGTSGADYVKRVVGVGGDRVVCCDEDGRIAVNGRSLDETQLKPGDAPSRVDFDIVVPEDRLFVLGDHRSASRDSRDHLGEPGGGMVPVDRVVGRADWIVWPADRWTSLERPRAYAEVPDPDPGGGRG
ncbi:signal peptidase I [Streptomyces sp. NPDC060194]|uniref:signal peptidase I n=1 Tax=Streptomyces sp. NPDC060194 TaxID=3347069 RepID=UPI00364B6EB8